MQEKEDWLVLEFLGHHLRDKGQASQHKRSRRQDYRLYWVEKEGQQVKALHREEAHQDYSATEGLQADC